MFAIVSEEIIKSPESDDHISQNYIAVKELNQKVSNCGDRCKKAFHGGQIITQKFKLIFFNLGIMTNYDVEMCITNH